VQRLESIFNQTFQDFEVILLDDCSADDSVAMLQRYAVHPKVTHFIVNKKNTGSPFKQWKRGIELARGEYVWIAESDDWAALNFLEHLLPLITQPNVNIAFCNSNWVNEAGAIEKSLSLYTTSFQRSGVEEIRTKLLFQNTIQNVSSVLFRAARLKTCLDNFTEYRACGDWILYTEILLEGDLVFTDAPLNYFRWYHQNTSNAALKQGTWTTEGISVLKIVKSNLPRTNQESLSFAFYWLKRAIRFGLVTRKWPLMLKMLRQIATFITPRL
jgi:glycosyltransferase involved in cell wall biosynthesis